MKLPHKLRSYVQPTYTPAFQEHCVTVDLLSGFRRSTLTELHERPEKPWTAPCSSVF